MRFHVKCKGKTLTGGQMIMVVRSKSEELAINHIHEHYKYIDSVEIIERNSNPDSLRIERCSFGIAHKRSGVKGYSKD